MVDLRIWIRLGFVSSEFSPARWFAPAGIFASAEAGNGAPNADHEDHRVTAGDMGGLGQVGVTASRRADRLRRWAVLATPAVVPLSMWAVFGALGKRLAPRTAYNVAAAWPPSCFPGSRVKGRMWPLAGFSVWHLAPQRILPSRHGRVWCRRGALPAGTR